VHVLGRYAGEATLFRLATQLETAQPWAGRLPAVHAANRVGTPGGGAPR
jgi:amidase